MFRHGRIRHLPPSCRFGGVPVHHDPVHGIVPNPGNREWAQRPLSFFVVWDNPVHRVLVNWDPPISQVVDLPGTIQNGNTSILGKHMRGEAFCLELRTGGSCSLVEGAIYLVCISPMVRKSRFYWWGRGTQLNASFWDLNLFSWRFPYDPPWAKDSTLVVGGTRAQFVSSSSFTRPRRRMLVVMIVIELPTGQRTLE